MRVKFTYSDSEAERSVDDQDRRVDGGQTEQNTQQADEDLNNLKTEFSVTTCYYSTKYSGKSNTTVRKVKLHNLKQESTKPESLFPLPWSQCVSCFFLSISFRVVRQSPLTRVNQLFSGF